ncbi:TrkA C-terminal domain-containing protein, partial [Kitasatospora sp. Root187]
EPLWQDPSGGVQLAEVAYAPSWVGHKLTALEEASGARIAFLTRLGEGVLPTPQLVVQEGDLVHVMLRRADLDTVEAAFAQGPQEDEH